MSQLSQLKQKTIKRIIRLQKKGFSAKGIRNTLLSQAEPVDLSEEDIRKIICGKRKWIELFDLPAATSIFKGDLGRCPLCGALVALPCLACQTREHQQKEKAKNQTG